jgi:pimeloyl-ACP methyl ester carboxylesterase
MLKGHRMFIWVMVLSIVLIVWVIFQSGRAPVEAPGGINVLEQVKLGGVTQWISIRGAHPQAPVLLFLHGGPGSANLAKLRLQVPELEQHFVVVNWDQAGAGKSASVGFDYRQLSIEQMVSDAHELVTCLKARFGVEKIYLMGFSWGTVIGLALAARYPEDFIAYIGVSQEVNPAEGEQISLEYVRLKAAQTGDTRAIKALAGIDPAYVSPDWLQQLSTERNWLLHYGGVYHTASSYSHELWLLLRAHEYSLVEVGLWPGRSRASLTQLWPAVMQVNFFETIPSVDCPIYFFVGRFDDNAPGQLTEAYFQKVEAPAGKRLVWFEHSAHDIFYDEPQRLEQEVLAVLKEQSGGVYVVHE